MRRVLPATIKGPDHGCLFGAASEQPGHTTVEQAHACSFDRRALLRHARPRRGRFLRVRRGLYRLRDHPSSPRDEVSAAWLSVGRVGAVVFHETAIDLLELSE